MKKRFSNQLEIDKRVNDKNGVNQALFPTQGKGSRKRVNTEEFENGYDTAFGKKSPKDFQTGKRFRKVY